MNEKLKVRIPEWTNQVDSSYNLILTNDLDSLFTVALLRLLFGCEVGMFYDFHRLYKNKAQFEKDKIIGCDLAVEDKEIRTFCNHVTKMSKNDTVNPLSANFNNIGGIYGGINGNYFRKYNGSTALTVLAIYNAFDKLLLDGQTELTETQQKILVCIDSYFLGAYHPKKYEAYDYFYRWQKTIGLEMFQPLFDKHSKWDFEDFQRENGLKKSIGAIKKDNTYELVTFLDLDFLQTHFPMLDFSLPKFDGYFEFDKPIKQKYYSGDSKHDLNGRVFSLAVTNRNEVKVTQFK